MSLQNSKCVCARVAICIICGQESHYAPTCPKQKANGIATWVECEKNVRQRSFGIQTRYAVIGSGQNREEVRSQFVLHDVIRLVRMRTVTHRQSMCPWTQTGLTHSTPMMSRRIPRWTKLGEDI